MLFPRTDEPGTEIVPLLQMIQLQIIGASTLIKSIELSDNQDWRSREAADHMLGAAEKVQDAIEVIVP